MAFISKKISQAERTYDIVNKELPAVKLDLEEWQYWLEEEAHSFANYTNYKNLEYPQNSKPLSNG